MFTNFKELEEFEEYVGKLIVESQSKTYFFVKT